MYAHIYAYICICVYAFIFVIINFNKSPKESLMWLKYDFSIDSELILQKSPQHALTHMNSSKSIHRYERTHTHLSCCNYSLISKYTSIHINALTHLHNKY